MKNIVAVILLGLGSQMCAAEQVTLVCKGWQPIYKNFADWPLNELSDTDSFVIDLDTKKKTAKYNTQIGDVSTDIKIDDKFYSGKSVIDVQAGGERVTAVNLSMQRMTGSTYISYDFAGRQGKVLFSGTCAPGKPLF